MPSLTKTSHRPSFTGPLPAAFTFTFPPPPTAESPNIGRITATFPAGSTLTTDLHWHVTHTEYLRITGGAALITLNNRSRIYTAADPDAIEIPIKARHEWMRWDCPGRQGHQLAAQEAFTAGLKARGHGGFETLRALREEALVAEEWTRPADGEKEIFFRNLFSGVQDPRLLEWLGPLKGLVTWLHVMVVMWALDNYLVVLDLGGDEGGGWGGWVRAKVEEGGTGLVMGLGSAVGRFLGLRAVNEEYTPSWLWERREGRDGGKQAQGRKSV